MNSGIPKISVLMSVYNGEKYLRESIESILGQTFRDFEFVIIDDCSTDSTPDILAEYANSDQRIRVLRNDTNLRLSKSLNIGIAVACGEYIARQDADDVSLPTRLQEQVDYLREHPDTLILGGGVIAIDEHGMEIGTYLQLEKDIDIKWRFFCGTPLNHTTVLVSRSALEAVGGYPVEPEFSAYEDGECWARIARIGKLAGIPKPLAKYRLHSESLTGGCQSAVFVEEMKRFGRENLGYVLGEPVDDPSWSIWTRFTVSPLNPPFSLGEVRKLMCLLPILTTRFYDRYNFDVDEIKAQRRRTHLKWARRALSLARQSHPERKFWVRVACVLLACKLLAVAFGGFQRLSNSAAPSMERG
jgi:glycosyltransferase involved in cell wall biosynthesis